MKARSAVLGGLAAFLCAATVVATAGASVYVPPRIEGQGNMAPGTGEVVLNKTPTITPAIQRAIDRSVLTNRISPAPLAAVLRDATTAQISKPSGGALKWKSRCGTYDNILAPLDKKKRLGGWCWDSTDQTSIVWVPQGITSTAESSADGRFEGQQAVAATWYRRAITNKTSQGIRVSLFPTPVAGRNSHYNHVALVAPSVDGKGFLNISEIKIHAGGAAWYGPYLYVPDTSWGFRVFDVRTMYRVGMGKTTGVTSAGAAPTAVDARYAMLQVASYRTSFQGCKQVWALPPCFSSLSIDRSTSPPRLVVSEHLAPAEYASLNRGTNVVGFSMGEDSLPATDDPTDPTIRKVTSDQVLVNFTHSLQGALVNEAGREIYTSASNIDNGWLYYEKDGDGLPPRKTSEWPAGAESLTSWYGTGKIWSLTERVNRRMVFTVYACELRGGSKTCR